MSSARLFPLTLLLVSLAACDTMPARTASTSTGGTAAGTAQAGPAANDNLNAIAWMQSSVEFRLIAGQTWRGALVQLDKAIKTPGWDALTKEDRANPAAGLPMAVIVDIDETVLDNTPYGARLVRDGKAFDDSTFNQWVDEAAAKPVPGALEFARAAASRGVTIFYISNRTVDQAGPTVENLRKAGFPIKDVSQYLGKGLAVPGCESRGSDKGCRRQLVGRTHRVLMQFGDQLGDLVTITTNTPTGREQAVRPYLGWVGERWFMLPNPSYGSWETALYGTESPESDAAKRQQKLNSLRY